MYLSDLDIVAISIALVSLMALVVTSAVTNARLTRERAAWRNLAIGNGYVSTRKVRELDEQQKG